MTHRKNNQKVISFSHRTWEQIKLAYLNLQTRYRKVVMPLVAKLQCMGNLYTGSFIVTK